MTLFEGRPADYTGRLEKEIRTYDFLDRLGVHYQRIDHEPAMTMEVCADIDEAKREFIIILPHSFYAPHEQNYRTYLSSQW